MRIGYSGNVRLKFRLDRECNEKTTWDKNPESGILKEKHKHLDQAEILGTDGGNPTVRSRRPFKSKAEETKI